MQAVAFVTLATKKMLPLDHAHHAPTAALAHHAATATGVQPHPAALAT